MQTLLIALGHRVWLHSVLPESKVGRCEARSRHILHSAARTASTPAVDLQAEPADEPA